MKYKQINLILGVIIILLSVVIIDSWSSIEKRQLEKKIEYSTSKNDSELINHKIETKLKIINKKNNLQTKGELKFEEKNVVFYIPHQDDETLFFAAAIVNAVRNVGSRNVYVVLISDGSEANYKNTITKEIDKYAKEKGLYKDDLDEQQKVRDEIFSQSRDKEFKEAIKYLGVKKENVKFLKYKDGNVADYSLEIKESVKEINKYFKGDVLNVTYSPYVDSHDDHKALGMSLLDLYMDGEIKNVYFVVKNFFVEDVDDDLFITSTINTTNELEVVKNASKSYGKKDFKKGRFAAGLGSSTNLFKNLDIQISSKRLLTYMHSPSLNLEKLTENDGLIDWKNKVSE